MSREEFRKAYLIDSKNATELYAKELKLDVTDFPYLRRIPGAEERKRKFWINLHSKSNSKYMCELNFEKEAIVITITQAEIRTISQPSPNPFKYAVIVPLPEIIATRSIKIHSIETLERVLKILATTTEIN